MAEAGAILSRLLRDLPGLYFTRHGNIAAGSLTLTTLISLVPATVVGMSIIAQLPGVGEYRQRIIDTVLGQLVPENAAMVKTYLLYFVEDAASLSLLQLVLLILSTLLLIHSVNAAINQMFATTRQRHGFAVLSVYLSILVVGPVLLGASFVMSLRLVGFEIVGRALEISGQIAPVETWLPFLLAWLALSLIYYLVPSEPVRPTLAVAGGALGAFLIELNKTAFGWYLVGEETYEQIYGALSVIPLFIIWVYLTWSIVLIGALIVSGLNERAGKSGDISDLRDS